MKFIYYVIFVIFFSNSMCSTARATAIDFDCDTPKDRFSSISVETTSSKQAFHGQISPVVRRTGKFVAVAGVRMISKNAEDFASFQLVWQAKNLEARLIQSNSRGISEKVVGSIDNREPIYFKISGALNQVSMLSIGKFSVEIAHSDFLVDKFQAFCSTGQFKFIGLVVE